MESILEAIFMLALGGYSLKASLARKPWMPVVYALALGAFSFALYPLIIQQPLTILSDLLLRRGFVEDIALLTTAESFLAIASALHMMSRTVKPAPQASRWATIVSNVPSVLVLLAVVYFQLLFFKERAGESFLATSLLYSAVLSIAIAALAFLLRGAIKGDATKLELRIIIGIATLVSGLLVSSAVAEYNVSHATVPIEWSALLSLAAIVLLLAALGVWLYKSDLINKIKTTIKWNK